MSRQPGGSPEAGRSATSRTEAGEPAATSRTEAAEPAATSRTRLAWFLARRYLGATRKGGRLLSFITWIALGGVVVGVTALVVVIGVMTGMQNELRDKILGSNPHILVRQTGPSLRLDDWPSVAETVAGTEGVVAASPSALTRVSLFRSDYAEVVYLYGVDLTGDLPPVTAIEDSLRSGQIPLSRRPGGLVPVAVGSGVASRMNLFPGDTVTVVALENFRVGLLGELAPKMAQWEVTGIFSTGMYDYDFRNAYAALEDVQELLDMESREASLVGARTDDPWNADAVADSVGAALGGWPYAVDPWTRTNRQLFSALKLEKLAMAVILSLIVLVAAFNIVSTLVMVVVNRTREIGILKAMGLTRRDTLRAFLFQGLWIGATGTAVGTALGLVLAELIERYRLIPIPPDVYFVDRLPVSLSPGDVLWIVGVSLLVSFAATIYPARQASNLEPIEAIRHE